MRNSVIYLFLILMILIGCNKATDTNKFYSKKFKWTISIPENYIKESDSIIKKTREKGLKIIKTNGYVVGGKSQFLFIYKKDDFNTISAKYYPVDLDSIGLSYDELKKRFKKSMYDGYKKLAGEIIVDTSSSIEIINGKKFYLFQTNIQVENVQMTNLWYSRMFENEDFVVNIGFIDKQEGNKLIKAFRSSHFSR